jgi:hypothetical protein
MSTNQELVKLWANDQKRKAFINDYKSWGVWLTQPELDLTYYKYDLPGCMGEQDAKHPTSPGGSRIIVMENLRSPYSSEKKKDDNTPIVCISFYLQTGDYFNPSKSSDSYIAEHLKEIKAKLAKGLTGSVVA